jgi:translation initiation factor IF-2
MFSGAVVLAAIGALGVAHAQRDPGTKPDAQTAPAQTERQAQPATPATPAEPAKPRQDASKDATKVTPTPAGNPTERAEAVRSLAKEEAQHRDRLAKLARLRALAEAKHQQDRLTQIADLERKENERFEAKRERARAKAGDDAFRKADEKFAQGRKRKAAAAKPATPATPPAAGEQPPKREATPPASTTPPKKEEPKGAAGSSSTPRAAASATRSTKGAHARKADGTSTGNTSSTGSASTASKPDKPRSQS